MGKDSMPYKNTVEVDELVFDNFKKMLKGKKKSEDIFDRVRFFFVLLPDARS